jgi:hypothetical protein
MTTRPTIDQVKDIIRDCCGGNYSRAADILHNEFVIIPKADLPEVTRNKYDSHAYHAGGEQIVYVSEGNARDWCLRDIAVWQFMANEESTRNARRDELAREIAGEAEKDPDCRVNYAGMVTTARIAIDRIIELEGKVS